jgi:hypothetical protein
MARNQTDWANCDALLVDAVHEDDAISVPVYGDGSTEYAVGDVVTVSPLSAEGLTKVEHPAADGGVVTHIIRADAEDPYDVLKAYVLECGQQLLIPVSALDTGFTVTPGDELIATTNGRLKAKAQATDYVVFKALTDDSGDYLRVITILGQTPTA